MAKRKRGTYQRSYFPVQIPLPTLAGGVGRQAPTKRTPSESEEVDNFLVSLEHSAEKRRGFKQLERANKTSLLTEILPGVPGVDRDLWFHWYEASSTQRFLIVVDFSADPVPTDPLLQLPMLWVYRIQADGSFTLDPSHFDIYPGGEMTEEMKKQRLYLTWGNEYNPILDPGDLSGSDPTVKTAAESLRAVAVGSSILILNTNVKAGFDSTLNPDSADEIYHNVDFNGVLTEPTADPSGVPIAKLRYETTVTVDPENEAEAYNDWAQYIAGDLAFDRSDALNHHPGLWGEIGDCHTGNSTQCAIDEDYFGIWKVRSQVTGVVGPHDSGLPSRNPLDQIHENVIHHEIQTWGLSPGNTYWTEEVISGGTPSKKATGGIQFKARNRTVDADHADYNNWRVARTNDELESTANWYTGSNANPGTYPVSAHGFGIALYTNMPGWGCSSVGSCSQYPPGSWGVWMFIQLADMGSTIPQGTLVKRHNNNWGGTGFWLNAHGATTYADLAKIFVSGINSMMAYTLDLNVTGYFGSANNVLDVKYHTHYSAKLASTGTGFDVTCEYLPRQWERDFHEDDAGQQVGTGARYTEYTLASDYYYPDPDQQFLGQAVSKLSDLKFPPTTSALSARNNAEEAMIYYYPDSGHESYSAPDGAWFPSGKGKMYYLSQPYLGLSEGHYRVIDIEEQPYLEQVRTPDPMSVIDKERMPLQLYFDIGSHTLPNGEDSDEYPGWIVRHIDWDFRTSGSINTNPGPSIFHDNEGGAVHSNITAMAFYRDRLFLSSADKLISSRLGDWDNFWLDDFDNITVNDPIDLSVSSNSYTPITYLQPYRSFLFLGTSGDTQYELLGSENQISPLTAEISPTSFFGMAENVQPVLMNNNLFFFDRSKLYIYFGEQSDTQQQAIELSVNAPGYLPTNYSAVTVSSDKSSIYIVDSDNPNHIYAYTNRVSGDEILQNSFYRFVLPEGEEVLAIKALDTDLYAVTKLKNQDDAYYTTLRVLPLDNLELNVPRLDSLLYKKPQWVVPGSTPNSTALALSTGTADLDTIVIADGEEEGREFTLHPEGSTIPAMDMALFSIEGDVVDSFYDGDALRKVYYGKKYEAKLVFSPVFYRDVNLQAVNGVLNLRYGLLRYRNSGPFEIHASRKRRTTKVLPFNPFVLDDRDITLSATSYKDFGVFRAPLLGYAEDLDLSIVSKNIHPLTISSCEFVGKFKVKPSMVGG